MVWSLVKHQGKLLLYLVGFLICCKLKLFKVHVRSTVVLINCSVVSCTINFIIILLFRNANTLLNHFVIVSKTVLNYKTVWSRIFWWSFLPGRAALQKRIMALLRKIEHCVNGIQPVSNDLVLKKWRTCIIKKSVL
jgi:hypothetical protein